MLIVASKYCIFQDEGGVVADCSGIEALFHNCKNLRYLNMCGMHLHAHPGSQGSSSTSSAPILASLASTVKGLTSLAISACFLCESVGRRVMTTSRRGGRAPPANKRRRIVQVHIYYYRVLEGFGPLLILSPYRNNEK